MNDLKELAARFPNDSIEWRVSRSGMSRGEVYCIVLAYITARAIQERLDDVCGPDGWRNEEPRVIDVNGKAAFVGGISIRDQVAIPSGWITKWDVSEPTNIEPAKGGFSGAMKRAGAQWGIGRYLYYLPETFAETTQTKQTNSSVWTYAKDRASETPYWWKKPQLPGWALPKEPEHEVSVIELSGLKNAWKDKFATDVRSDELLSGFSLFVGSIVGEFPHGDSTCWTRDALDKCHQRIRATTDPDGVSSDVPFE